MAKPRLTSVLLIAGLVVSLLAAINFFLDRNAERARRIWTEEQLRKVTEAKEALEKERDELTTAKQALETQLADLTDQAKAISDQLAQEKRAKEALTTEVAQARRETTDLRTRLDTERKEKLTLTEELSKAKQSYQALSNELVTLRQAKEALEKRVKEMLAAQAQEAEKIVVRPGPVTPGVPPLAAATAKPLEGKVLVVNREFNFVVVNLGSRDGIKAGTPLLLLRQDRPIGKAQVERIYENMSAANLIIEELKAQIQEGDLVRVTS